MRRSHSIALILAALLCLDLLASTAPASVTGGAPGQTAREDRPLRVLVFSRTEGYRHEAIEVGIDALRRLGERRGFRVRATENPRRLSSRRLRRFGVVVFLNTTGDVLGKQRQRSLRRYIRKGGGFAGVHAAADTEYDWPFYGRLIGAWFETHPPPQEARLIRRARRHPATRHLPRSFRIFDEFYSFRSDPADEARVLLEIDESSYEPPAAAASGGRHPLSWCKRIGRGRSFYTALGHETDLYSKRWYRHHLLGGILTAAQRAKANCTPRG